MFCFSFSRTFYLYLDPIYHLITMCELNAMLVNGTDKKLLMEDVIRLVVNDEDITITGMFGDTCQVKGKILRVDITKQEALIQKID